MKYKYVINKHSPTLPSVVESESSYKFNDSEDAYDVGQSKLEEIKNNLKETNLEDYMQSSFVVVIYDKNGNKVYP